MIRLEGHGFGHDDVVLGRDMYLLQVCDFDLIYICLKILIVMFYMFLFSHTQTACILIGGSSAVELMRMLWVHVPNLYLLPLMNLLLMMPLYCLRVSELFRWILKQLSTDT